MDRFHNFLLVLLFIGIGILLISSSYKKPAPLYSTNVKGYVGGTLFLVLGILSLLEKYSIFEVLKELINK